MESEACPRVAVSILNWNGWPETFKCLDSVRALYYPDYLPIVVDNGSVDGSPARMREWAGKHLRDSHGFAEYTSSRPREAARKKKK